MKLASKLSLLLTILLAISGCSSPSTDSAGKPVKKERDPTEGWLRGEMTCLEDGTVMPFRIEKKIAWGGSASGGIAATHPTSGEKFMGKYTGILPSSRGSGSVYSPSLGRWVNVQTRGTSSTANAIGSMTGTEGTVIQIEMLIQSGFTPHGLGSGTDNKGRRYQVQF